MFSCGQVRVAWSGVRERVLHLVAERGYSLSMANAMKTPPVFNENETDYEVWKKDLDLWCSFTDLPKSKMAIAVHLSLSGRARQATSEISVNDMKGDKGIDMVLQKLDRVFLQDKNWRAFNNYLAFENYRRDNESIDEFLSEFDRRYFKLHAVC